MWLTLIVFYQAMIFFDARRPGFVLFWWVMFAICAWQYGTIRS